MVSLVRVICVAIWGIGWWLVLATPLACSSTISLTKGIVGQGSPWC